MEQKNPPAAIPAAKESTSTMYSSSTSNTGNSNTSLSMLTYNIHSCVGSDGVYSVDRIAAVVKEANADIVCLQEVEVNANDSKQEPTTTRVWSKPHQDDQPAAIAAKAGYSHYQFAPAIRSQANLAGTRHATEVFHPIDSDKGGLFGVALLSKYPILDTNVIQFAPYLKKTPRNALACLIEIPDNKSTNKTPTKKKQTVWIICTHLGMHIRGSEQYQQAQELRLFVEGLLRPSPSTQEQQQKQQEEEQEHNKNNNNNNTVILAGDFNSASWYAAIKELKLVLIEANRHNEGTFPAMSTGWFVRPGSLKLDYIFHSPDVICTDTQVQIQGAVASDHLAFQASLLLPKY